MEPKTLRIKARRLNAEDYAPYGNVIEADESKPYKPANFGRAKRFNYLSHPVNGRPQTAQANVCVFRCSAFLQPEMELDVLERHPHSTQIFLPMQDGKYITIVALGNEQPDLDTIAAFIVEGPRGISYAPGVWHYPMTALASQLDMACIVFEDETEGDCQLAKLSPSVVVQL